MSTNNRCYNCDSELQPIDFNNGNGEIWYCVDCDLCYGKVVDE